MLVCLAQNLAFLAMPKTGSTAIESVLSGHADIFFGQNPRVKHLNARRFERFQRPYLRSIGAEEVETMCLLREPADWLASWYRYRCRSALAGTPRYCGDISFDQFVEAYLGARKPDYAKVGSQAGFVTNWAGEVIVKHIFAYERMEDVLRFLEKRFGKLPKLPRANVSPTVATELSSANRARLREIMVKDYEIYELALRGELHS